MLQRMDEHKVRFFIQFQLSIDKFLSHVYMKHVSAAVAVVYLWMLSLTRKGQQMPPTSDGSTTEASVALRIVVAVDVVHTTPRKV